MEVTQHQFKKLKQLTEKITSKTMAVAIAKRIAEALRSGQEKVDAYKWYVDEAVNAFCYRGVAEKLKFVLKLYFYCLLLRQGYGPTGAAARD